MDKIGRYRILQKLGAGGMGLVSRAWDTVLEREVAIKTLLVGDATEAVRERFIREARLYGSLSHPNIVNIYEMGEERGTAYIAMELLRGSDLRKLLHLKNQLGTIEDKVRIIMEVGSGLAHAHANGVVHRDIKPSNIFVCESGAVKILDFGLAHIASSELTRTGQILGTPNYMSPEQVMGRGVDERSDIFSLGAVFYELLAARRAFPPKEIDKVLLSIVTEEPEAVDSLVPTVPRGLCRIVEKAMAKEPMKRYQRVEDLLQDLKDIAPSKAKRRARARQDFDVAQSPAISSELSAPTSDLESDVRETLSLLQASRGSARAESDTPAELDVGFDSDQSSADSLCQEAALLFSRGELGGCLKTLSDALRLDPKHDGALALAERLRWVVIEMVNREDARLRDQVLAALPGDSKLEDSVSTSGSHSDEVASLGDFLLSEQGPFAELSRRRKTDGPEEKPGPSFLDRRD